MSYVIQNFLKNNQRTAVTPRFKIFIILKWANFFLFFFKFNSYFKKNSKFNSFYTFFFKKGLFRTFYESLINLSANYMNKITITGVYWNFKILNNFLNFNLIPKNLPSTDPYYFYNLYFLAIKLINVKLTKTHFKLFFFFTLFYFSEQWLQFDSNLKFYLNFFFIRNALKTYKFYNGYFLRVYNF